MLRSAAAIFAKARFASSIPQLGGQVAAAHLLDVARKQPARVEDELRVAAELARPRRRGRQRHELSAVLCCWAEW